MKGVTLWPILKKSEGYYPGSWSDTDAVERVAEESDGLPVLWDMELPLHGASFSPINWWHNRLFLDQWLRDRKQPVAIWRSYNSMGLNPLFLRLAGLHFDLEEYPEVSLHLDLYNTGSGIPAKRMKRIIRCGVEHHGKRFVPSLGVLDDGLGEKSEFTELETFKRDLKLAREAGVFEIGIFGVNGLTPKVIDAIHDTLPLQKPSQKLKHN